jgi:DNA-directed RNA polymerase beta subunit/intein/homing endonuclease
MASSSARRTRPAKPKDPIERVSVVLASDGDVVGAEDADKLVEALQDEERERVGVGARPKKRASSKPSARSREAERALKRATVVLEETPDRVELPEDLYPEVGADVRADRNDAEADLEALREDTERRAGTLGSGADSDDVVHDLAITRAYFAAHGPASPLHADYNEALVTIMQAGQSFVVETPDPGDGSTRQRVELLNVRLSQPTNESGEPLYPHQCRRLGLSYLLTQRATLRETRFVTENGEDRLIGQEDKPGEVEIVRLPQMLGSRECYLNVSPEMRRRFDECPHDPLGYFIVDGRARALTGQEKLSIDLSILVDHGAKYGTDVGFECNMLCMTPTKALAHHIFYQQEVVKKSEQYEILARVQNLTQNEAIAANALSLLRALIIVSFSVFDYPNATAGQRFREALNEHIDELCKGAASPTLARNFRKYLATTLDKALEIGDDDAFIEAFAKAQNLPLHPRKAKPKPKPPERRRGGPKKVAARKTTRHEEPAAPVEEEHQTPPDMIGVWVYIIENLFPQVTVAAYEELYRSRAETEGVEETEEVLAQRKLDASEAAQRAKEHLVMYNIFRLFLYGEDPAGEKDDRDHFGIKRVELAGSLIAGLYLKELQKAKSKILHSFNEKLAKNGATTLVEEVRKFFDVSSSGPGTMRGTVAAKGRSQNITAAMHSSFTSDRWGGSGQRPTTTRGVSHPLETESLAAMISGVRKVSSKGDQAKRTVLPHLFHPSQGGLFCPSETPDDESCLDVDEEVLMADGTHKRIGDLQDGDAVMTMNQETGAIEPSVIHSYFIKSVKPEEDVYEVLSLSGRTLRVTGDHPFVTQRGKVEARELRDGDKLAIAPHFMPASHVVEKRELVLDEAAFLSAMEKVGVHEKLATFHARHLRTRNLLPLYSDDARLPVLARLYAFALGDGTVGVSPSKVAYKDFTTAGAPWYKAESSERAGETTNRPYSDFSFGTEADVEEFERDVVALGYKRAKHAFARNEMIDKKTGRKSMHSTWKLSHGSSFPSLLIALGMVPGKKTEHESAPVPAWVTRGSMLVKREFIAGFQGAEGATVTWIERDGHTNGTVKLASTSQQKHPDHESSLVAFMEQLQGMFEEFGVACTGLKRRTYAEDRQVVALKLSQAQENVLRFIDAIGYRYATTKRHKSEEIAEYMRYRAFATKVSEERMMAIVRLHEEGFMPKQIAEELACDEESVKAALQQKPDAKRQTPRWVKTHAQWCEKVERVGECLFVPFVHREPVQEVKQVADFTTRSDNHTFVTASAFCVSNCGIKKYLAITAEVSRELPSDVVIREVYARLIQQGLPLIAPNEWTSTLALGEGVRVWPLYVNGIPLGYTTEDALDVVRAWRREARVTEMGLATISAYVRRRLIPGFNQFELHVSSTPNRMVRPLHVVRRIRDEEPLSATNQALAIDLEGRRLTGQRKRGAAAVDLWTASWEDLVWRHHVIEFLDKREEETYSQTTAWFPSELSNGKGVAYAHCELNPAFTLGYNAGSMPFIDHQQGTRTAYGANQLKHAVSTPTSAYRARFDTSLKVLHSPQRPITTTEIYKAAGFYAMPTGTNAMVAIIAGKSNIEDALVINRASVERGMFNSTTFVTVKVANAPGEFGTPATAPKNERTRPRQEAHLGTRVSRADAPRIVAGSYAHLEQAHPTPEEQARAKEVEERTGVAPRLASYPAGIVPIGTQVQQGDVLATKISPEAPEIAEHIRRLEHSRTGRVDAIQMAGGRSGMTASIRIAFPNVPEVGDKLASIESQKGLIGTMRAAVDMPYSTNGQVPDAMMNPHGFPSRQTFSYVMEAMYGKAVLAPPRASTEAGTALKGTQPYNVSYTLAEVEEAYVRPNLVLLWMRRFNDAQLRVLRADYARKHAEEYRKQALNPNTLLSFPLDRLPAEVRERIVAEARQEIRAMLFKPNGTRRYDAARVLPEVVKKVFAADIQRIVAPEDDRRLVEDLGTDELERANDEILEAVYTTVPREFALLADLPDATRRRSDADVGRAVYASGDAAFLIERWDQDKIDRVTLEQLDASELPGAEELVAEVRSTQSSPAEGGEEISEVQRQIETIIQQSPEAQPVTGKRVLLSQVLEHAPELHARLVGRYGGSHVPIVDVVSLADRSSVAAQRLERLRLERTRTERVKQQAQNATAFVKSLDAEDVAKYLQSIGWVDGGEEVLRNGATGEELQCRIFTGPVYYHTMTQMASEKIQARPNGGAVSAVTRRPVGGRKTAGGGGGKLEEMATMGLISHGASSVLHGRLTEESVMMRVVQCRNCNFPCPGTTSENTCTFCGTGGSLVQTRLPFPTLKLKGLLATMGVNMSFAGVAADRGASSARSRPLMIEQAAEDFFEEGTSVDREREEDDGATLAQGQAAWDEDEEQFDRRQGAASPQPQEEEERPERAEEEEEE